MIDLPAWLTGARALQVAEGIAAFAVGLVAVKWLQGALEKGLQKKMPKGMARSISKLSYYVLLFLVALLALDVAGFEIQSLLVAGGVAGVAVGFASQKTVSNLISGLFLYVDRPFDVGDSVEISGTGGMVLEIKPLSTRIRTWDGPIVRLPNEKVFGAEITNYKKIAARRMQFDVGIGYGSSVKTAIESMRDVLDKDPYVLQSPSPSLYLSKLGDSAKIITVKAWAPISKFYTVKHRILEALYDRLVSEGVEIPNPQLDVHLKKD